MELNSPFTATWNILGVDSPKFIWLAALGLALLTLLFIFRLWLKVARAKAPISRVMKEIASLDIQKTRMVGKGTAASSYQQISDAFGHVEELESAWRAYTLLLIVRRDPEGNDEFWSSDSAGQALGEDALFGRRLNKSFYGAFPGIVTSLGLLFTFVAILIALMSVHFNPTTKVVTGVDLLINGLSGKFVSSIAALFFATFFVFIEKNLLHGLAQSRLRLVEAVDTLFPRLSPAHILAEMQHDTAEQTDAFKHFNADLSGRLKQSFTESMGPTLEHMVQTIDELNRLLRGAEAQKQESITGSLQTMLERLQDAISTSLRQMGDRFADSLSGTAMSQLTKLAESLQGTIGLLDRMNGQFSATQATLSDLVNLAKTSTAEQLALGKSQVEDLTGVLRQMMVQLNDTATTSTNQMAQALTLLVSDLSTNVRELNEKMAKAIEENARSATGAASTVIDQATQWSAKSSEQLDQILKQQQSHLENVRQVEATLMTTLELFNDSVTQYATLNSGLRHTASESAAMATAAAGAAKSSQETHQALQRILVDANAQVERIAEASRAQQAAWDGIRERMEQYRNLFAQTEGSAAKLFTQLGQATNSQLEMTHQKYDKLLQVFDQNISTAVQKLGASVNELGEFLEDLNESIAKYGGNTDGRRS
jgi:hypothetical protein